MVSKRLRAARRLTKLAEESEFYRIKANRTHSGKQVIPTVCRPLMNGNSKLDRRKQGHTWSLKSKVVTTYWGKQKKIRMYEGWGTGLKESVKLIPSMVDTL